MYLPKHFEETRKEKLFELIRAYPLGTLVTLGANGLEANHIPFEIDASSAPSGILRAHVARSNPVWHDVSSGIDALVVFQGASSYISPSWYPSKQVDGKVVPTYNYMVVHASGPLKVIDDPVWLLGLVSRLTDRHEKGRDAPWQVADAPTDYIEKMLAAIVGIEIPIAKLVGKWKVSQNQPEANRNGVVHGLLNEGNDNADLMAAAIRQGGNKPSA
jgi:transcriptional regulator